ncbi:hypothetical protein BGZ63DRAFT_400203 [Mariannaea sp. PMI_226]|nr:hypothetical protein BGZ63DRAFT_400203 [Mariannaea sp. PMI_226]
MAPKHIGPITRAWFKWKALRLPWRKRFLMGYDLEGNTYWEFRLIRGSQSNERWRRIVNYPRSTHYSQVKVSPQWHQWLRHTRRDPPTIEEQQSDVVRQEQIKALAAQADARWEAKPKVMEAPETTAQRLAPINAADSVQQASEQQQQQQQQQHQQHQQQMIRASRKPLKEEVTEKKEDPWAKSRAQGPGEDWQPAAWDPAAAKKR